MFLGRYIALLRVVLMYLSRATRFHRPSRAMGKTTFLPGYSISTIVSGSEFSTATKKLRASFWEMILGSK